jgi:hypothetical protein
MYAAAYGAYSLPPELFGEKSHRIKLRFGNIQVLQAVSFNRLVDCARRARCPGAQSFQITRQV